MNSHLPDTLPCRHPGERRLCNPDSTPAASRHVLGPLPDVASLCPTSPDAALGEVQSHSHAHGAVETQSRTIFNHSRQPRFHRQLYQCRTQPAHAAQFAALTCAGRLTRARARIESFCGSAADLSSSNMHSNP
ncbi:hypothetical protein Fuma_02119 [Fuerstiella marisgermanici]|uniref:Uncharacterized protein n=1 Tax=Fuerstiella marisgermanici TaxID=1891926 RepID=A0A1P8WEM6_9PLAN|nr:hypothetical protein Fuma_02119 [Fuerstiella marisgermanici]